MPSKILNRTLPLSLVTSFLFFISANFKAHAVCPVCTVAVGAGVGFSQWLGIDDSISGLWIGGLVMSMGFWTSSWLASKGKNIKYRDAVSVASMYALVFLPLLFTDLIGAAGNTIAGVDKIIFGTVLGSVLFYVTIPLNNFLKAKNGGKVYIPYQKVLLPVTFLLVSSLVMYFITK
jgi:hypothetical protein